MYLRRLFYARIGSLARERKKLLQHLPYGVGESASQASSRLADVNSIAQQLHDNSAAEFKMYLQMTSAYRRGVSFQSSRCQSIHAVTQFPPLP